MLEDIHELREDVRDLDRVVRSTRESLATISGEVKIIIALLVANGVLNIANLIQHHP